jgi:hypothetical protein
VQGRGGPTAANTNAGIDALRRLWLEEFKHGSSRKFELHPGAIRHVVGPLGQHAAGGFYCGSDVGGRVRQYGSDLRDMLVERTFDQQEGS